MSHCLRAAIYLFLLTGLLSGPCCTFVVPGGCLLGTTKRLCYDTASTPEHVHQPFLLPFPPLLGIRIRPHEHLSSWPPSLPPSLPPISLSFHHPKRNWEQLHPHLTLKIRSCPSLCSINGNMYTVWTNRMVHR